MAEPGQQERAALMPVPDVPQVKLHTGALLPAIGFGLGAIAGWSAEDPETRLALAKSSIKAALVAGYRHFDSAEFYQCDGPLREAIEECGVPRSEVFITSKLWNTDHDPADVEPACRRVLQNLGCEQLDLFLMHWPVCFKKDVLDPWHLTKDDFVDIPLEDTWRAMEALVDKGLCKAIGVCNCGIKKLERILAHARIKPVVNQVELHPYLQQKDLLRFCQQHDIAMTAYSGLGAGDRPWKGSEPIMLEDPALIELAKSLGRSPGDVCLRWAVQRGTVVLVRSNKPERIQHNLKVILDPLPEEAMEVIDKIDRGIRYTDASTFCMPGSASPYQSVEELWA